MSSGTGAVWDTCSLVGSPALKVFGALCPPVSCRQHILSPLHLQPLPQPPLQEKQGGLRAGWVGVIHVTVRENLKRSI